MDKPPKKFLEQIVNDPASIGTTIIIYWPELPVQYFDSLGFNHWLIVFESLDPRNDGLAKLPRYIKEIHREVIRRIALSAHTGRQLLLAYDLNIGNETLRAQLWAKLIRGNNDAELWLDIYYRTKSGSKCENIALKKLRRMKFSTGRAHEILRDAPDKSPLREVIIAL